MARSYFKSPLRIRDGLEWVASNDASAVTMITGSGGLLITDYRGIEYQSAASGTRTTMLQSGKFIIRNGLEYHGSAGATTPATLIDSVGHLCSAAFDVVTATLGSGSVPQSGLIQSSYTVSCAATDILLAIIPPTTGITSGTGPPNTAAASGLAIGYFFVSAANTVAIGWVNPSSTVDQSHTTGSYSFVFIRS